MEHLWAPWRNAYVTTEAPAEKTRLFTILGAGGPDDDLRHHVFHRSSHVYAVLNRFPYNAGHTLVVPYREVGDPRHLSVEEHADLWATVHRVVAWIEDSFHPDGFNIGMNIGSAAGAGIPHHLHVHIVPRWHHDANFMSAQAETRVHPADLDNIHQVLSRLASATTDGNTAPSTSADP